MKATLINAYKSYVVSGINFEDTLAKELNGKAHLPTATIENLAQTQAEAYGEKYNCTIFYRLTTSGRYDFFTDEDCTTRQEACRKQWQRKIQPYQKLATSSKVVKQVDKVAVRAKSIQSDFSKAEIKRLIKLLSV